MHRNQSGKDEKDGLSFEFVHAGALKVVHNPHEHLSQGARTARAEQMRSLSPVLSFPLAKLT
jgi:hypothetical protein